MFFKEDWRQKKMLVRGRGELQNNIHKYKFYILESILERNEDDSQFFYSFKFNAIFHTFYHIV